MNPLKVQKVLDKTHVHSATGENQLLPLPVTVHEEQLNTNVNEEQVSENLKIKKLNHDCLAQVLMHLSVLDRLEMEKVCQKWEEATQMTFYNIKKLNFNDLKIPLDKKEEIWEGILEKYGHYLTHLTITISCEYSWVCDVIQEECNKITHFEINMDFNFQDIPSDDLLEIVKSMPKLKHIKVEIDTEDFGNVFPELLELLPGDMNEIHLAAVRYEHDDNFGLLPDIHVVPDKFKSLCRLTLQGFDLDQSIKELISLNANTLVHLDLFRCDSSPNASVLSKLCHLEYLNLSWIKNLDPNVITAIAHNCQRLNHFEFSRKTSDNERHVMNFVPLVIFSELKYLINLEHLNFQGVDIFDDDDNFLSPITNNCKKLKHFDVECGFSFSDSDIKEITKLNNLESLNLDSASDITSELLVAIANNCLELKDLNKRLIDVNETAINTLINLKKLEKLHFYKCESLTGDLLIDIINNCKNLIDLDLSSCNNITEVTLLQVGNLQNLKRLRIDSIENVPNAMFDNFRKLEYLSCFNCPSVTDEGIIKVISNCQNLSHLNILSSGISVETLIHAARRQCIFKVLHISVNKSVKNNYSQNDFKSPYLYVQ